MESLKFSTHPACRASCFATVYNSVKGNTYLPLVSFSSYATTTKLVRGIKSFSTKVHGNKLNPCVTGGSEFLFWFSEFTDGEGSFSIFFDRVYIRFRFKINLHIDDIEVLKTIKSKLNIGRVVIEENKNSCAFIVQSFSELKDALRPIFIQFPLHTAKKNWIIRIFIRLF